MLQYDLLTDLQCSAGRTRNRCGSCATVFTCLTRIFRNLKVKYVVSRSFFIKPIVTSKTVSCSSELGRSSLLPEGPRAAQNGHFQPAASAHTAKRFIVL